MKSKQNHKYSLAHQLRIIVRKISIKRRLFFIFIIAIIIVLLGCYIMVSTSLSDMKSNVELYNTKLINTINEDIKLTYEDLVAATIYPVVHSVETYKPPYTYEYLSSSKDKQINNELYFHSNLNAEIRNLFNRYDFIDLVAIIKPDGLGEYSIKTDKYYTEIDNQCKLITNPCNKTKWFMSALSLDGSEQILSANEMISSKELWNKEWIYSTRSIVNSSTLQSIGIIVTGADMSKSIDYFEDNKLSDDTRIGLFNKNGEKMLGDISPDFYTLIKNDIMEIRDNVFEDTNIIKIGKHQFLYTYILNEDGSILIVETPYRYILSTTIRNKSSLLIIMISILVFAILLINIVISSITKPLYKLKKACNQIENGDFSVYIKDDGYDEITDFTSAFNSMTKKIELLIYEGYKKDLIKSKIEMQMLRSQINPHFLYNTLETIRSVAFVKGEHELSNMVLLLVKTLRYGISELSSLVTVKTEYENLNDYIHLQKLKNKDKVKFNIHIDKSIMDCKIIKLVLQPIVENAIYHGISTLDNGGEITVLGTHENDDIIFQVIDNGIGIDQATVNNLNGYINSENKMYKSIGIKNVNRRIKLFYGDDYGVNIQSSLNRGTMVTIKIPTKSNKNYS